jgi:hypothetical protein
MYVCVTKNRIPNAKKSAQAHNRSYKQGEQTMKENEKQAIEEMAKVIERTEQIAMDMVGACPSPTMYAKDLYWHGYRKQSEGEWMDKPTGAYGRMQSWCTACGKHSGIGGIESNRHKPYCPNCGAHMRGGAE